MANERVSVTGVLMPRDGIDDSLYYPIRNTGIALTIIGLVGLLIPQVVSITLSIFIASLLILAGIAIAYMIWHGYRRNALAWLKPFVLVVIGLLVAFYPQAGAAVIGLILAIFFLMDAFAAMSFSSLLYPLKGWFWVFFNGLLSLVLAIVFLVGWPFDAEWLVGFFISASLFFSGASLLAITGFSPK